jgi:hypothetical protein
MLEEHARQLTPDQQTAILCTNVADLYDIDLEALAIS